MGRTPAGEFYLLSAVLFLEEVDGWERLITQSTIADVLEDWPREYRRTRRSLEREFQRHHWKGCPPRLYRSPFPGTSVAEVVRFAFRRGNCLEAEGWAGVYKHWRRQVGEVTRWNLAQYEAELALLALAK